MQHDSNIYVSTRFGGENIDLMHRFIPHYRTMGVAGFFVHLYKDGCDVAEVQRDLAA